MRYVFLQSLMDLIAQDSKHLMNIFISVNESNLVEETNRQYKCSSRSQTQAKLSPLMQAAC